MSLHMTQSSLPMQGSAVAEVKEGFYTGLRSGVQVFGNELALKVSTRGPGWKGTPNTHDNEKAFYISDGEVWYYVDKKAYLLRAGDFLRIPRNAIHWGWNRSDRPVTVCGGDSPPASELMSANRGALYDEGEVHRLRPRNIDDRDAIYDHDTEIAEDAAAETDGLYIPGEKLPLVKGHQPPGADGLETRGAYGVEMGWAVLTWPAAYHCSPYVHDAEALIHVLEGQIWVFVEDKGFKCEVGDFVRIPRNAIHWEWNHSSQPARALVEYSPPVLETKTISLKGGITPEGWAALFEDDEEPRLYGNASLYAVAYDASKTEAQYGLK